MGAFHNVAAAACILLLSSCNSDAFSSRQSRMPNARSQYTISTSKTSSQLFSTTIQPAETTTIGTVGSGYLPLLVAKIAAHRQHGKSWVICPSSEIDTMKQLSAMDGFGESLPNLELVPASDSDRVEELLGQTDALLIATDDVNSVIDPSIINYLLEPKMVPNVKRVVAMSRNLNGAGMGMFVTASRKAANAQVWDNSNKSAYQQYESNVQSAAENVGADWTIVRAGTLKGGAAGEDNAYPQYLSESYYEMTKNDIITWQLLFDCNTRGVKLAKGDVMSGPGVRAVFTATGSEEHDGDSGRCGVAEAMVRSLELEGAAGVDFGVGSVLGREIPSEGEWEKLFAGCL